MKKVLISVMGIVTIFSFSLGLVGQKDVKQHKNVIQSMSVGDYGG
ncbi:MULTISPECIES: hypothetical protein [Bacillus]|uniref:Phr family secreted Rap phosphatase inhibitor n=1 Tax=Bacillus mycoides TaxID=1405 RepID=A0A3D9U5M3_BACMY|nr:MULTISPECIES: hypothetical protein [Bacillus]RBP28046.1 hypothetical protein DET63_105121 [Bacillus sp. DB-2]REF24496.1 hypothetical protein DET55_13325 [Bacillus mycoides]